jgi:hypothetical protein
MYTLRSACRTRPTIDPATVVWATVLCVAVAAIIVAAKPSFAQSSPEGAQSIPTSPEPSAATAPAASEEDKEKALHDAQNPIANTISVPFQNNTYFSAGPLHKTANVLIIEPVIPTKLSPDWNLVARWITPVVYLPRVSPDQGSEFGLSNLQPEFYFSPAHPDNVIWGVGPKLYLPTATGHELGINRMGGGPAAVAMTIKGPWVMGIIANNVWAGSGHERVNQLTLNPFVDYNLKDGWYLISSPVITSNWVAKSSDRWTVPVGGGVGRLFKISNQPVNARIQGLYNAARPDFAPSWQLQLQVQFLFPKK